MSYYKQVIGEKCYLSPIDTEDAHQYCKWLNDLSISVHLDSNFSLTPDIEKNIINELRSGNNKIFGIVDLKTDKLIGGVGLHDINYYNQTAMYGIYIGDKNYLGKGFGKEATKLILDYGFNILNLHNIYLMVYDYNQKAIDLYKKIGFEIIGKRRQARLFAKKRYDIILMDILADEFESVYVKNLIND